MRGQEKAKVDISGFKDVHIRGEGGETAHNYPERSNELPQFEAGYLRIDRKPGKCRSGRFFSMSFFRGGLEVRGSSIISLGLATLLLLVSVSFSETHSSENDTPVKSAVLSGRLLRTIIVSDYYPYTFVNDQGLPDGFSVDVARAVAQAMDMNLEIGVDTWEHAMEALENGTIDFLPMMASSPSRRQSYDFSVPHTIAYDAVFVRKESQRIGSLNDLDGKTIIVMNKDAAHDFILTTPTSGTIKLITVDSLPEGLRLLASGAGDAAIMPKLVGLLLVKKLNITNIEESPVTIESYKRPFSFAVKKGNSVLLEGLSQGLSIVEAKDQYSDIYDKWFGVLLPPGMPWQSVLKYIAGIVVASVLFGMVLLVWSLSLKKMVTQRTRNLESEISARKRTEAALRESEERFRLAMEATNDGVWDWDLTNGQVFRSEAFFSMLGYKREDFQGLVGEWLHLVHPDDLQTVQQDLDEYLSGKRRSHEVEFRVRTKSGDTVWVLSRGKVVVRDENEKPVRMVGTHSDITERKKAEEALTESEDRFRRLTENARDTIYRMSLQDGRYEYVSPASSKMFGYSPDEFYATPNLILEILHPEWLGYFEKEWAKLLNGDILPYYEYQVIHKDGDVRWINQRNVLIRDDLGKPVAIEGIATDITDRKRAEEAILASEEKYRTLFEESFDGLFITSPVGKILDMNKKGVLMFGYDTKEEILNLDLERDVYAHPPDRTRILAMVNAQGSAEYEVVVKKKNGEEMVTYCSLAAVKDEKGAITSYRGIIRDITERKRAQHALEASEHMLKAILATSPVGIALTKNRRIEWVNEACRKIFGLENEHEYLGQDVRMFYLSDEEYELVGKRLYQDLESGKVGAADTKLGRKDGSVFDAHVQMKALDPLDPSKGVIAAISDISFRKRSEEVQRRLATAIEQSAESVMITNADGVIQYVNRTTEQITGFEMSEIIGNTPRIFKSGMHDKAFYEQLWDTIKAGNVWSGRIINKKKDGTLCHEDATISPVRDASGKIANFVAVKRDVTEHLELSRQLQQAQKMEAIGTLAGGVAHDFNNLLTVVTGFSELLLIDKDQQDPAYADLQKINQAARNGADLVQRLLAFSRKAETKPRPLNLNHQIEQLKKMLTRTIPKMIEIELNLAYGLSPVNADPTQMDQILMNLSVNARDAMPEGGKLAIETANFVIDEDYARSHLEAKPGKYVLLSVSDTGSGMDKEILEHIFEPFYTTKEAGKGTGLGLAMVYGIVTQHGGHMRCYSEPGHGTTFRIYLPALVAESDRLGTATREAVPMGGTETILLVDDEELVRDLGKRILERSGYKVLAAANGTEALDLYPTKKREVSLVILDLIMPEMGGKQCLEELLKINPQVKVLIASGYSAASQAQDTIEVGAKGFVNKPYNIQLMLKAVRDALNSE
ncbi:MAG: PAS domain S-box protein [Desulfomonile tiedjei]|uniref:histidine kinase n=1 Tax=Desulfomonile tiedjei TaxID=2358 RepID=A0A9D6Z4L1_9BACT|nr:PAS domain S-box protein [Desulfomonile tiedjei]